MTIKNTEKAAPCAEETKGLVVSERALFESLAKTEQGLDLTRLPHGGYRSFATHQAWWAWQASRRELHRFMFENDSSNQ